DFDSGDLERQQYVLKTLGAEWTLLGSNLTFTPVKYLVPIKKPSPNFQLIRKWLEPLNNRGQRTIFMVLLNNGTAGGARTHDT
ncbi:hypothetical protein IJH16_02195, partial [Candidatus Saccharibacteria bacterium]|nr:hypothetical protein [Candidatus Saccharibacteria bacterium]